MRLGGSAEGGVDAVAAADEGATADAAAAAATAAVDVEFGRLNDIVPLHCEGASARRD